MPRCCIGWTADKNTAKATNENLAREFMELFALGHGNGYTEDDVRDGARALTGWVIRPGGQTTLRAQRHDRTPKTLFGVTSNFDAAGSATSCWPSRSRAEYVAGRLWRQLASDTPPSPEALDRLVAAYGPRPRPAGADAGDPHRRRIRQQPGGHRQHAGRVARRGDPQPAGPIDDPGAAEDGRRHAEGAGAAAVLSARRRRLAARPGLDVDRQRRRADAGRDPAGPRR